MTAISQQADAIAQADRPQLERTFAMALVGAGCWVTVAGVAYFLVYLIALYAPAAGNQRIVANLSPIFVLIGAIFGVIGALALFWVGARRRAWFWMAPVILTVLYVALNAKAIPQDLARPTDAGPFLITVVHLAGALAAIAGGIVAFVEVRRGRAIWTRSGRVG